jgi:ion channel
VGLLRDLGYTNVRHHRGGLTEWLQPGVPAAIADSLDAAEAPSDRPRRARGGRSLSTRFNDALGDQSVGALFGLWITLVIVCAVAYWLLGWSTRAALVSSSGPIGRGVRGLLSAFYFSSATATSVGYGDIVPQGPARLISVVEAVAGLVIFGCVVSKFVSRRRRSSSARFTTLPSKSGLAACERTCSSSAPNCRRPHACAKARTSPRPKRSRVESAAMVFVGEMHAVHDLLYRPQHAPDEGVLEAILAELTSVVREFNELLACVHGQRGQRSPALAASIRTMARLAKEICGDCVPREFAPSVRNWMDQIQRMAGEVERI